VQLYPVSARAWENRRCVLSCKCALPHIDGWGRRGHAARLPNDRVWPRLPASAAQAKYQLARKDWPRLGRLKIEMQQSQAFQKSLAARNSKATERSTGASNSAKGKSKAKSKGRPKAGLHSAAPSTHSTPQDAGAA
jgi:hypothetical protein